MIFVDVAIVKCFTEFLIKGNFGRYDCDLLL